MELWAAWMSCVQELKPACARTRSFLWMVICLIGFTTRMDLAGVSSFVRALGLQGYCYDRILDFLHSPSLNVELLAQLWLKLVLRIFPNPLRVNNRLVLLADGIKVAKEGRKMPAVKSLHQESQSNSKAEYIMGHSCQAIALLVSSLSTFFAVPLICRIHEGIVLSNRDSKTLIDKMLLMLDSLKIEELFYFVADAYYANRKMVQGMVQRNSHLVTRVKSNAIAWLLVQKNTEPRRRGRPKFYDKKILLNTLFNQQGKFKSALSPIYGEKDVSLLYRGIQLYWRSAGIFMLYVLVIHPTRGRIMMASSDLLATPLDIISLYGLRFKIELAFKNSLRVVGTFVYHFWMQAMDRISRGSGNQYLHCKEKNYRDAVKRKIDAYHRHIQLGLIAQGLLQYLSSILSEVVWKKFGSWLRTIREGIPPSEQVTAIALRNSFPDFLANTTEYSIFKKFLLDRIDFSRSEGIRLCAYGG